jgi:hypothetical protein
VSPSHWAAQTLGSVATKGQPELMLSTWCLLPPLSLNINKNLKLWGGGCGDKSQIVPVLSGQSNVSLTKN